MNRQRNRQTDMTLLMVAFHNIADEPKCVTTLEYSGKPSVKIPLCTDPNTSALIYISCHVFIIYMANVELRVTVCWMDGWP